jgi:hypothetical protein
MKYLLLAVGLLVAGLGAQAQSWVGKLPIDTASSLIAYQGRVAVPGASAAVLHQRAEKYMRGTAHLNPVHAASDAAFTLIGFSQQDEMQYRLVLTSAKGSYTYLLVNLAYCTPKGEASGKSKRRFTRFPIEKVLAEAKQTSATEWQDWQTRTAATAQEAISELKGAMKKP